MKIYFIYDNTYNNLIATDLLNFIKSRKNINIIQLNEYANQIYGNTEDIINIFHNDCVNVKNKIKNKITNILIVSQPLIDSSIQNKYDFLLPTSPYLYYYMFMSYEKKMLLPIIIDKKDKYKWGTFYCNDNIFRKIKNICPTLISWRESLKNSNIILYSDVNELSEMSNILDISDISEKIIFHYEDNFNFTKNFMKLMKNCKHNSDIFNFECVKNIRVKNYGEPINIDKGKIYLIARYGFNLFKKYNFDIIIANYVEYYKNNNIECFSVSFNIEGVENYEYCILIKSENSIETSLKELLNFHDYDARIIGINNKTLSEKETYELYQIYGKNKIKIPFFEDIKFIYMDVIICLIKNLKIIKSQSLNATKFLKISAYWSSQNNYILPYDTVKKFILDNPSYFLQKNILLISKEIVSYGGNQKTALQLYKELMVEGYDVKIGCVTQKHLVKSIDKCDIFIFLTCEDAYKESVNSRYSLVIVNKLDEMLKLFNYTDSNKVVFITHNSMDPVNSQLKSTTIVKNSCIQSTIRKILTVNQHHISNLYDGNLIVPVTDYYNYNEISYNHGFISRKNISITDVKDTSMKRTITYIGRLSDEKNVKMLVDSFIELCDSPKSAESNDYSKIRLIIIGDGKSECYVKHPQIIFTGRLDYNGIISWLSRSDFLVSTTCTEGLPYSYIESMNIGIPIITPRIVGCTELVNSERGILYDFIGYDSYKNKNDWTIFDIVRSNQKENILSIKYALTTAFSMNNENWNVLSKNCIDFYNKFYKPEKLFSHNINSILCKNSILIITNDLNNIDQFFVKQFPLFDFTSENCENLDKYDIVIYVKEFDILSKKLSLLKTPKMANINIKNMNNFINILYKIRKECRDKNIYNVIDKLIDVSISFPSIRIFCDNNKVMPICL